MCVRVLQELIPKPLNDETLQEVEEVLSQPHQHVHVEPERKPVLVFETLFPELVLLVISALHIRNAPFGRTACEALC